MPTASTLDDFRHSLACGDRRVRSEAISSIASRYPNEAAIEIKELLDDPDRWVRLSAARHLAYLGNPAGIPVLREELEDGQVWRKGWQEEGAKRAGR